MKKKRVLAGLLLLLMILQAFSAIALASSKTRTDDLTQSFSGVSPDGYEHPFHVFDYEKGITGDEFERLDGVYLAAVAVFSDYAVEGLKQIENNGIMYPEYLKRLMVGGIPDNGPYDDRNYLLVQVYRGVSIRRDQENELKPFLGQFFFDDCTDYVDWDPSEPVIAPNSVWYAVTYSFYVDVAFNVSNIVFNDDGIFMDIYGEQNYQYSVKTKMHDNYGAYHEPPDSEKVAYEDFRAKTEKQVNAEETKRTISAKGAKAKFVLYDIEGFDDKNLFLEVEAGGIKIIFLVRGVIANGKKTSVDTSVEQKAKDTPGEDEGVDVPGEIVDKGEGSDKKSGKSKSSKSDADKADRSSNDDDDGLGVGGAVAVGVLSTGAAVGAGAAVAASGKGKSNNGKKKKSYKMYVQKDFGDAIRRGAPPVKIRARMAEIDENGTAHDRNDLTALISVTGEGMTVHGAAMAGRYCEATVSVPPENQEDTANVCFIFNGEGGSFANKVIFRLVDGPSLKFVEEAEEPGKYHLYHSGCGIEAIPGDNFTYTRQFMIVDATVAPQLKDIKAVNTGKFDVKFEATDHQGVYKMSVKNNTKPEPEHDLFEKVKEEHFEIHVTVEGEKEPVKGYVTMELYPEGITISSPQEGKKGSVKYVRVQAFEKENVGDLDRKWQVSQIKFTLAFKGKDKAIIDPNEAKFKFEKLKGAGGLGMRQDKEQALAEKYPYEEAHTWMNDKYVYEFEPQKTLCEPEQGFMMVLLPVKCTYDKKEYMAEIPLRLRGTDPDPYEDWDEEYKKLKERIEKYSLPEEKEKWLAKLDELALDPKASTQQLRLTSKMLVRNYVRYWTTEGIASLNEAALYDNIVNQLEWLKFFGDCAFSYLVSAYAGPVAEALISPAKDFMTQSIGEVIACWNYGEKVDVEKFEIAKMLEGAGDNLVSGAIDVKNWKKAAATLSAYFVYSAIKNYFARWRDKGESDFYGSFCRAFSDLTVQGLKVAAGELFQKWLKDIQKNKKLQDWIAKNVTQNLNKYAGNGRFFNLKDQKISNLQYDLNKKLQLEGELGKLAGFEGASKKVGITKIDYLQKIVTEYVGAKAGEVKEVYDKTDVKDYKFGISEIGHITITLALKEEQEQGGYQTYSVRIDLTQAILELNNGLFGGLFNGLFGLIPTAPVVMEVPTDPPLPPEK
jgi:hypothetical protein